MLGDMINIKIDNMKHQHQSIISREEKEEEPKIPAEEKDFAFISVCVGDGLVKIFKDLGVDEIIEGGQTMNPSTDDIINAINRVNAKCVYVFPNNKNIIMAANQASEISDKNVVVIPTKSIPQCVGAMIAFSADKSEEKNTQAMTKAIGNVLTGQITFAVRDTEIDDLKIKEGDIIGMNENKITVTGNDAGKVLKDLIAQMYDEDESEFLNIYYGEDVSEETANTLAEEIEEEYPDLEVNVSYGGQALYYYIFSIE